MLHKEAPPNGRASALNETKQTSAMTRLAFGYLPRLLRPSTTACKMRFRTLTTLSSFSVSVRAVMVPAAVKTASASSAQFDVRKFMGLVFVCPDQVLGLGFEVVHVDECTTYSYSVQTHREKCSNDEVSLSAVFHLYVRGASV